MSENSGWFHWLSQKTTKICWSFTGFGELEIKEITDCSLFRWHYDLLIIEQVRDILMADGSLQQIQRIKLLVTEQCPKKMDLDVGIKRAKKSRPLCLVWWICPGVFVCSWRHMTWAEIFTGFVNVKTRNREALFCLQFMWFISMRKLKKRLCLFGIVICGASGHVAWWVSSKWCQVSMRGWWTCGLF